MFCVGMRVKFRSVLDTIAIGFDVPNGYTGTIVSDEGGFYGIRFDTPKKGFHNCRGDCEAGHGYYVSKTYLVPIEDFSEDKVKEML